MKYDLSNTTEQELAIKQFYYLLNNEKKANIEEIEEIRTGLQSRSRWLYLTMIAAILTERGETFQNKGLNIDIAYTKDNLYLNYWQPLRFNMYPGKKKQLNTKEFCDLVEMAGMMFAKVFQISIPFPNLADFLHKQDLENNE